MPAPSSSIKHLCRCLLAALLLSVSTAQAQQHSLKTMAGKIARVIGKEDTTLLSSLLLTYQEYKTLYNVYLQKLPAGYDINFERNDTLSETEFNRQISEVKKNFSEYFLRRKYDRNQQPLIYRNYTYRITGDEHSFTPVATIGLNMQRDTSLLSVEGFECYRVNNGWKLFRTYEVAPGSFYRPSNPEKNPAFQLWKKKYERFHEERFPYPVAQMFWRQLFVDTAFNNALFLTWEEFSESISDKLYMLSNAQLNHEYDRYLHDMRNSLAFLRDSAKGLHCMVNTYDPQNIVNCVVKNRPGVNAVDGANLSGRFSIKISCSMPPVTMYLTSYVLLQKLNSTKKWKITFFDAHPGAVSEMDFRLLKPMGY